MKKVVRQKSLGIILMIVLFILISRVSLTIVGIHSKNTLSPKYNGWYEWNYSENKFLDIWEVWDSGWYLDIAENGYSSSLVSSLPKKTCCGQNNFGFFPLYPLLIRQTNFVTDELSTTGLIISNIFLFLAAYILYKLTKLADNEVSAKKAVVYLLVFPTSFILSGVFSESLFLFLAISAFYFAEKKKWLLTGLSGFFLALTKSAGVLIIIPLLAKFLMDERGNLKKSIFKAIPLLFVPLGLATFMAFTFFKTGSPFYYAEIKSLAWNVTLSDPFEMAFKIFKEGEKFFYFIGLFIVFESILVYLTYKLLPTPYFIYSLIFFLLPLMSGVEAATSSPRHAVLIFPFYLVLSKISKNNYVHTFLMLFLLSIQTYFMYHFASGVLIR